MPAMTLLNDAVDFKKLDVRVVERNVDRGVIRAEDVQKAIQNLPDDSDSAIWVSVEAIASEGETDIHSNGQAATEH